MWITINDCGKQLTIHSKLREKVDTHYKIYDLNQIEFDQYHLELLSTADVPVTVKQHNVFTCEQLLTYHFEVEVKEIPAL